LTIDKSDFSRGVCGVRCPQTLGSEGAVKKIGKKCTNPEKRCKFKHLEKFRRRNVALQDYFFGNPKAA
jgi:hypothetical protein